jgi:hypothetical protein
MLDPELVVMVSNLEYDKVTEKFISNHSLTTSITSTNPEILAKDDKVLLRLVKDVEGMGIKKGSKVFTYSFI